MAKYKILGIVTDTIRRNGKVVLDKYGKSQWGAIGWYRIVNPLAKLGANIEIGLRVGAIPEIAQKIKELGDLWVCKMADNEDIDHKYATLKELTNSKFILDLDDDIDHYDPSHPEFEQLEERKHMRVRMVEMADHIIVSTQQIKDSIKHLNSKITVIPNAIDPEIWNVKKKRKKKGTIKIGWMSSGSHFVDSPIIEDIMVEICQEYPHVEFHIAGMIHNETKGYHWYHHKGTYGYKPFPQFYADLGIDIAIAPLKDIHFNRCKSNIKYLEASMLEIPMVASDVDPYRCIQHGKTGYLASTSGQFKKYLIWLIENEEKRKEMGKAAKQYVLDNWTIDKFLPKYQELFDKIMEEKDITVVTAITGGKDDLKPQPEYKGIEYVAFSDKDLINEQWDVRKACDKFAEPVMNAKIHKILAHKYVKTPYILWMDGSMTLQKDPHELVKLMGNKDFAFFKHPGRDCVYEEADACVKLNKGNIEDIAEQMQDYIKEEVPFRLGLCEMTAFIRKNNKKANDLFEKWWVEVCRYSSRDQLSMPKVFRGQKWATIPGSVEQDPSGQRPEYPGNEFFKYKVHKK
jgi:glycosyltransferase involved in cell wall biosynthesis